jgi:hypothetical protein
MPRSDIQTLQEQVPQLPAGKGRNVGWLSDKAKSVVFIDTIHGVLRKTKLRWDHSIYTRSQHTFQLPYCKAHWQ